MPVKVSNNASSRLATTLTSSATQFAISAGTGSTFPDLDSGDWFPVTVTKPDGTMEIMRATAKAGDTLTVLRAQEGTAAQNFSAGDRVELRLTAGALNAMMNELRPTFTAVQQGGGTGQQANKVYIGWNGTALTAQIDAVSYGTLWSSTNFNPASYMPLTGGTFSGALTVSSTAPQITFQDTDWGPRYLHSNSGLIGFLTSGGGWSCYSQNDGTFIASGNIGAYSDRKHKEDIALLEDGLAIVERMRGVRYTDKRTGARRVGVIAQEVQRHLPEVVGEGPDGLHVDYGNIVGPLVEAVKALSARVRFLEAA